MSATKQSKTEREIPFDITYMWHLKYDTSKLIYVTEINLLRDVENRLVVAKGGQGRG